MTYLDRIDSLENFRYPDYETLTAKDLLERMKQYEENAAYMADEGRRILSSLHKLGLPKDKVVYYLLMHLYQDNLHLAQAFADLRGGK